MRIPNIPLFLSTESDCNSSNDNKFSSRTFLRRNTASSAVLELGSNCSIKVMGTLEVRNGHVEVTALDVLLHDALFAQSSGEMRILHGKHTIEVHYCEK